MAVVMGELKRVCGLVPAGHWSIAWMDRINRTTMRRIPDRSEAAGLISDIPSNPGSRLEFCRDDCYHHPEFVRVVGDRRATAGNVADVRSRE
jgi:hypothetical protein